MEPLAQGDWVARRSFAVKEAQNDSFSFTSNDPWSKGNNKKKKQ